MVKQPIKKPKSVHCYNCRQAILYWLIKKHHAECKKTNKIYSSIEEKTNDQN